MTRARALKQVIRARAEKTGERYTTARRHILRELGAPNAPNAPNAPKAPTKAPTKAPAKGGLSEAKTIEKTGHDLAYWFDVLDKFGAAGKGHTASAKHLYDDHGVPGWYCQGITVSYERVRGLRAMNQRCDGDFEVSVSKTMAATPARIIKAMKDARTWTDGVDPDLVKALTAGLKGGAQDKKPKGFVIRPDGLARLRYKWDGATVQFYLTPKGAKTAVVVQHTGLDGEAVEPFRARWKAAFGAIADLFA